MAMVLEVGESYNLERAVCNHGFFMMAPNRWIPSQKCLRRPLRLASASVSAFDSVNVSITQPPNQSFLLVTPFNPHNNNNQQLINLSPQDKQAISEQVRRMLRISSEDESAVEEFHRLHPEAREHGFARIFRSPTLFEDIVKSLLLCNCTWSRSLEMAEALCNNLPQKRSNGSKKRKHGRYAEGDKNKDEDEKRESLASSDRNEEDGYYRNFPCPEEIACHNVEILNKHCNLGYRASIILQVAKDIVIIPKPKGKGKGKGKGNTLVMNLGDLDNIFEQGAARPSYKSVHRVLSNIKGFGPFTIANICMCLGFYHQIPVDTETIKHVKQVHGKTGINKRNQAQIIQEIYGKYAPFQCLAYWMEHVQHYEKMVGKLSELPHSQYCNVSTTKFKF